MTYSQLLEKIFFSAKYGSFALLFTDHDSPVLTFFSTRTNDNQEVFILFYHVSFEIVLLFKRYRFIVTVS